jgi:catechol 2,3-dioxygenase-like lactoylglutathione lyase family enzyme
MKLVEGVHHVTFLTEDIDRLATFYERVLEARKTLDMAEEGLRHIYLEVGPTTVRIRGWEREEKMGEPGR